MRVREPEEMSSVRGHGFGGVADTLRQADWLSPETEKSLEEAAAVTAIPAAKGVLCRVQSLTRILCEEEDGCGPTRHDLGELS
jgi:hypothetical protein